VEVRCTQCGASVEAPAHLRRFLAGDRTVAGLDREAKVAEPELVYFPFWAFTVAGPAGEKTELMPAAPSSLQGLHGLELPTGVTAAVETIAGGARVLEPEVPAATARGWLAESHGGEIAVRRTVLYHLPLYRMTYTYRRRSYHAAVDGVTGRVYTADYPAKAEAPYVLVAVLAILVFGLEGLAVSSAVVKAALYLISALPILGVAWLVSRKV